MLKYTVFKKNPLILVFFLALFCSGCVYQKNIHLATLPDTRPNKIPTAAVNSQTFNSLPEKLELLVSDHGSFPFAQPIDTSRFPFLEDHARGPAPYPEITPHVQIPTLELSISTQSGRGALHVLNTNEPATPTFTVKLSSPSGKLFLNTYNPRPPFLIDSFGKKRGAIRPDGSLMVDLIFTPSMEKGIWEAQVVSGSSGWANPSQKFKVDVTGPCLLYREPRTPFDIVYEIEYYPGSIIIISGAGFRPNQDLTLALFREATIDDSPTLPDKTYIPVSTVLLKTAADGSYLTEYSVGNRITTGQYLVTVSTEISSKEKLDGAPFRMAVHHQKIPAGFTDLKLLEPSLYLELLYFTPDNFTGEKLDGYENPRALLLTEAALALQAVQKELLPRGFSLKIWDAFRPLRAEAHMIRWARANGFESLMTGGFIPREITFDRKYGHACGICVDLTIVNQDTLEELEMGTEFDHFSPAAWTLNAEGDVLKNRLFLKNIMEKHGFKGYSIEWWHFTYLIKEPRVYDFPIK